MRQRLLPARKRRLVCERLEPRHVLSALVGDFHPMIVAGDPNDLDNPDSPSKRVDANTTTSPFAGVGSIRINTAKATYICTGTPIDRTHVLTAGHCVDLNNDGKSNSKDGITSVIFNLNYDGDLSSKIPASSWTIHPDFSGFARPWVNDDLAILTLSSALPEGVPTYALASSDLSAGTTLHMVGYGQSGYAGSEYTVDPSFSVKRYGQNNADAFLGQDDARKPAANEVFRFDFDGPSGNGTWGGGTLGNNVETTLGGGDSGGPSFVQVGADPGLASSYVLAGVNTFTQGSAPQFGSLGGGISVFPYRSWIGSIARDAAFVSSGSGGPQGKGLTGRLEFVSDMVAASVWLSDSRLNPVLVAAPSVEATNGSLAVSTGSSRCEGTDRSPDLTADSMVIGRNLTDEGSSDRLNKRISASSVVEENEPEAASDERARTIDFLLSGWLARPV